MPSATTTLALGFMDLVSYVMEAMQRGVSTASHSRRKAFWEFTWIWSKVLYPLLLTVSSLDLHLKMMLCEEDRSGQPSRCYTQVGVP